MPSFEVFIPKSKKLPMNLSLKVEAESWVEALKAGRSKLGESGEVTDNVLVDIKEDNSIHVTDAGTGQVFKIRELGGIEEPAPEAATEPEMQAATQPEIQAAPAPEPEPVQTIGRTLEFEADTTADYLADIFETTQSVHEQPNQEQALYFMLDLAMDKIQTDSGSILLSDINKHDLSFGAARGPKAGKVMNFKIKIGQGIVGFCVSEGVGVAISDVTRDPRFYSAVSEKIGYSTRSILCVPMEADGRVFGALELINRKQSDTFSELDLNVANFIANQLAQYLLRQKK
ncbi:MAG TPA: GAF domain-containing protein [Myxococcota bacterium]|nr:GAF domain-containing protein [Myxococcota bacterium]